jgi:hypothetical protein
MAPRFEYVQAEEVRDAFARHRVRYLFIGKSGAILLGYPDTTQDADLFLEKTAANGATAVSALRDLGFDLTEPQADEIRRGKDFVQLRNGPFDLYLVFAPDGIETFDGAWQRRVEPSHAAAGGLEFSPSHPCLSLLARSSAPTRSSRRSAPGGWARSIARATRASGARWRSRCSRPNGWPTRTAAAALCRRRAPPPP